MDLEMDLGIENGTRRQANPSILAARQRRAPNYATANQTSMSQTSSSSTTSFPSPMNSNGSVAPHFDHQMTAPLPSPSASDLEPAYPPYPRSQSAMTNPSSNTHPHYQQSQSNQMQPIYSSQQTNPHGHQPSQGVTNNPAATTSFLKDFNLVAEAAKRAQMAVVMRDLEAVSL